MPVVLISCNGKWMFYIFFFPFEGGKDDRMIFIHFAKYYICFFLFFYTNFIILLSTNNKKQQLSCAHQKKKICFIARKQSSFILKRNKSTVAKMTGNANNIQYIDIGANLADKMFNGYYMGTQKHENDLEYVLYRAKQNNVEKIILTCGSLKEIDISLRICRNYDPECKFLYITVGIHPTNVVHFINRQMLNEKEERAQIEYEKFLKDIPQTKTVSKKEQGVSPMTGGKDIESDITTGGSKSRKGNPQSNTNEGDNGNSNNGNSNNGNSNNGNSGENNSSYCDISTKNANTVESMKINGFQYDTKDEEILYKLNTIITKNRERVVSIGEIGIDFDRLHFAPKHLQIKYFVYQLKLAQMHKLPLFLHMRNCADVFFGIVDKYKNIFEESGAVIHSFTDHASIIDKIKTYKNFYIGVNGCSLKTTDNLNAVKQIPLNLLMLETDAPWCGIKRTHASYEYVREKYERRTYTKLKGRGMTECGATVIFKERNEPFTMGDVAEATYKVKAPNMTFEAFCQQVRTNTLSLFQKIRK